MRYVDAMIVEDDLSLNSLCGISVNATGRIAAKYRRLGRSSQFPLWDFGECNLYGVWRVIQQYCEKLSIPFVGFR